MGNHVNTIKIALAQTRIVWEDKETNLKRAQMHVKEASDHGAHILFFPEMSFTGFSMHTKRTKEADQTTIEYMKSLAKTYQIGIGFGWVKDCGVQCENHYTVIDSYGSTLSDYTKIHPFSYSGEDQYFRGGTALTNFVYNGIEISTFLCYDLRFPEIFQAASKKAKVIVLAANWPAQRHRHWNTLLRARAIENQVYLLAVNCVGECGGIEYAGESCIINPDGCVQAYLSGQEGIVYFDLLDDVQQFRDAFPIKQDRREPLYQQFMTQLT